MSITVEGVLSKDAEYRTAGISDAVVVLTLAAGGSKYEAKVLFGQRPEDHVRAQAQAALLRRNASSNFIAGSLRWCEDHGEARFIASGLVLARIGAHVLFPA